MYDGHANHPNLISSITLHCTSTSKDVSTFSLLVVVELIFVLVAKTTYSFNYLYVMSEGYNLVTIQHGEANSLCDSAFALR